MAKASIEINRSIKCSSTLSYFVHGNSMRDSNGLHRPKFEHTSISTSVELKGGQMDMFRVWFYWVSMHALANCFSFYSKNEMKQSEKKTHRLISFFWQHPRNLCCKYSCTGVLRNSQLCIGTIKRWEIRILKIIWATHINSHMQRIRTSLQKTKHAYIVQIVNKGETHTHTQANSVFDHLLHASVTKLHVDA